LKTIEGTLCKRCGTTTKYIKGSHCKKCLNDKSCKTLYTKAYGISHEERDFIFTFQGEVCAICRTSTPGSKKGWCTDHCHRQAKYLEKRKSVRGILCFNCNVNVVAAYEYISQNLGPTRNEIIDTYLLDPPAQQALKLWDSGIRSITNH
jgi:Recombination endonuclease VII